MAKRNLTPTVWAANAAGLLGFVASDPEVPERWRTACEKALADAPDETLVGALAAVLSLQD